MKEILLLTVLIWAFTSNAQEVKPVTVDTDQKAKIVFEKTVYDYGVIAKGSAGTCVFKFTNEGKGPLILKIVAPSCGCTSTSWSKDTIAPGKTGQIDIKYKTNVAGSFSKSITVKSNASNSSVLLQIKGEVK